MSTPAPSQNEPSKMKRILNASMDETIKSRLPHGNGVKPPAASPPPPTVSVPPAQPVASEPKRARWQFLPAFWTIASLMSISVNIILIAILLIMLNMLAGIQMTANDQVSGLLGGLYDNFVKMDQARIQTMIHVEKDIPVQFELSVNGGTDVELTRPVEIRGAVVDVSTGGLNIRDANATIILPAGVILPINIRDLKVPVNQSVRAVLDVPIDIPLNQTQLHEPFVGLRQVVEPWYCLVEPNATVSGIQVCSPTRPASTEPLIP